MQIAAQQLSARSESKIRVKLRDAFTSSSGAFMILIFAIELRQFRKDLQRGLTAFRVPTLVGLFRGKDPTKVGTLYTATVPRAIYRSRFRYRDSFVRFVD